MREHKYIKKFWGSELWFKFGAGLTAKKSECFRKYWSTKGLFQYHKRMNKIFFVISGSLLVHTISEKGLYKKNFKAVELHKDDSINIRSGTKYRFTAVNCKTCIFIELSTGHDMTDWHTVDIPEFKI